MTDLDLPEPFPTADSAAFWEGCAEGRLRLQTCADCGTVQHYPRSQCASCGSESLSLVDASGAGSIFTFTVNHRAPRPGFAANGPYVIALIDLDEGPRMMMNVIDCDPAAVVIGQRVRIVFRERGPVHLPQAVLV